MGERKEEPISPSQLEMLFLMNIALHAVYAGCDVQFFRQERNIILFHDVEFSQHLKRGDNVRTFSFQSFTSFLSMPIIVLLSEIGIP